MAKESDGSSGVFDLSPKAPVPAPAPTPPSGSSPTAAASKKKPFAWLNAVALGLVVVALGTAAATMREPGGAAEIQGVGRGPRVQPAVVGTGVQAYGAASTVEAELPQGEELTVVPAEEYESWKADQKAIAERLKRLEESESAARSALEESRKTNAAEMAAKALAAQKPPSKAAPTADKSATQGKAGAGRSVVRPVASLNSPHRGAASSESRLAQVQLNTVYRDQAWLKDGERTFVVQVGDVIAGAKVLRIDPSSRVVFTSAGAIR